MNARTHLTVRDLVLPPDPEQQKRDAVEAIARALADIKGGESLKVDAHDDGTWTVTFTTTDAAYR